jgi:NTP pyrophosphatase (non-canonical NTP hydrolase)
MGRDAGVTPWVAPRLRGPTDLLRGLRSYDPAMELAAVQAQMEAIYGTRDRARGVPATVAWLAEEVGELAKAARKGTREEQLHELGDVLAWLASLANQLDCSLEEAAARYARGCPRCHASPCACPPS